MTKKEQLQRVAEQYREERGEGLVHTRDIARWAIQNGHYKPDPVDVERELAKLISDALREEMTVDPQGRTVRKNHAVRLPKIRPDGKKEQLVLWDTFFHGSEKHMITSFQQRRTGIVGDCKQLYTDVESWNENNKHGAHYQLVLDFTEDIEEAIQPTEFGT